MRVAIAARPVGGVGEPIDHGLRHCDGAVLVGRVAFDAVRANEGVALVGAERDAHALSLGETSSVHSVRSLIRCPISIVLPTLTSTRYSSDTRTHAALSSRSGAGSEGTKASSPPPHAASTPRHAAATLLTTRARPA